MPRQRWNKWTRINLSAFTSPCGQAFVKRWTINFNNQQPEERHLAPARSVPAVVVRAGGGGGPTIVRASAVEAVWSGGKGTPVSLQNGRAARRTTHGDAVFLASLLFRLLMQLYSATDLGQPFRPDVCPFRLNSPPFTFVKGHYQLLLVPFIFLSGSSCLLTSFATRAIAGEKS